MYGIKYVCIIFVLIPSGFSKNQIVITAPGNGNGTKPRTADRIVISKVPPFIAVHCDQKTYEEQYYPVSTLNFTKLYVQFCAPPNTSYAGVLKEHNLTAEFIRELVMDQVPYESVLKAQHLDGLDLREANIRGVDTNQLVTVTKEFLQALSNVDSMHFENVIIDPMPETLKALAVIVNYGRFQGGWRGCENLEYLILSQVEIPFYNNWLANCTNLANIVLNRMPLSHSIRWVTQGVTSVKRLIITDCDIKWFANDFLTSAVNLESLMATNNKIQYLEGWGNATKLKKLELSWNPIVDSAWHMEVISRLPVLEDLILSQNKLTKFCDHFNKRDEHLQDTISVQALWTGSRVINNLKFDKQIDKIDKAVETFNVQRLSLASSGISKLCFANWTNLHILDLTNNSITNLEVRQLPINTVGRVMVMMEGNRIERITFDEEDYELLKSRGKDSKILVTINSYLDCDCHAPWFAKAYRDLVLLVQTPICRDGTFLDEVPPQLLECDKFDCQGCTCRRLWKDNITSAQCASRELHTMPRIPFAREIFAGNNLIETVHVDDIPDTLMKLDLQNNRIARLDDAVVKTFFSKPNRTLRLSENPLICDCESKVLLEALQTYKDQVVDYYNTTCAGDGKIIDEVDIEELCRTFNVAMTASLTVIGMLVGITAFLGALYCRFGQSMKIFLYSRGCCLSCMAEDDLDEGREYDAFISFAHDDAELVMNELVPELEKDFKICVHYRDWYVGDMIPAQITRSVESSRRTIVVLSKKFVKSLWGLLEFRTAHMSALSEGRVRVIVVVIDDVTQDDTLDTELRGYLLTNTYLKWDDPWFWRKLKFAMPHKKLEKGGNVTNASGRVNENYEHSENIADVRMRALPALEYGNSVHI